MKLGDLVKRLADLVELEIVVDDYGNVAGTFTDMKHIAIYSDCEVETIDTTEDGTLVVYVNGNVTL